MKIIRKITVDEKGFSKLFLRENGKPLKKSKKKYKWIGDKLFPVEEITCSQCGKKVDAVVELEKWNIPVCINPSCPNFGLLQIGMEKINEFNERKK
jgi:hypothetical protein